MATSCDGKFIETSSGIQHNVDQLLVGIVKQVRLKREKEEGEGRTTGMTHQSGESGGASASHQVMRRASSPLRTLQVARDILTRLCIRQKEGQKSEPTTNAVDNLLVL